MIDNLQDLNSAIDNAVYGETLVVCDSIYDLIHNIWECQLLVDIKIKNLNIVKKRILVGD